MRSTPVYCGRRLDGASSSASPLQAGVARNARFAVRLDPLRPTHFGQAAGPFPPHQLHLQSAIFRGGIPEAEEARFFGRGKDVRHAPRVAQHLDLLLGQTNDR